MTLSKLLGSSSRTLEARAPARRDSEKIDDKNFMKYVHFEGWTGKKDRVYKKVLLHQLCVAVDVAWPTSDVALTHIRARVSAILAYLCACTARADCAAT
jgi:hypothetical protein